MGWVYGSGEEDAAGGFGHGGCLLLRCVLLVLCCQVGWQHPGK